MVYSYDIKIPLSYNRYAVYDINPDREICFKLNLTKEEIKVQFETYEIPGCTEGMPFNDNVVINLSSMNNHSFLCEIKGMLVDDDIYARQFAEMIVDRICKRLSLLLCKLINDYQSFQPRVEAMWSKASFVSSEYQPFIEARNKALESTNNELRIIDSIRLKDRVFFSRNRIIPNEQINIKEWLFHKNEVIEFLLNEYYCALGTEKTKRAPLKTHIKHSRLPKIGYIEFMHTPKR